MESVKKVEELSNVLLSIFGVSLFGMFVKIFKNLKNKNDILEKHTELISIHSNLLEEQMTRNKNLDTSNVLLVNGMLSVLRMDLNNMYDKAFERGYTTQTEFNIVASTYQSYSSLGGNGQGTAIYEKFKTLEIKKENEK